MKKRVVENIVILSLVIIGSYLALMAFLGLVVTVFDFTYNEEWFLIFFISSLGLVGYVGLLSLLFNRYKKNLLFTFICLICGLLSLILFKNLIKYPTDELFSLITDENEFPANWIFVWFIIMTIYYTVVIGKKNFSKKKEG